MIIKRYNSDIVNVLDEESSRKLNKVVLCTVIPILIIFMIVVFLFLSGTIKSNKISGTKVTTITKLNETYNGALTITATDIKVVNRSDDEDAILVGVRFEVKNNSNDEYYLRSSFEVYIDGVHAKTYAHQFNTSGESLVTTLAPDKIAKGYAVGVAKKGAKKIEIQFEDPNFDACATFVFDIPKDE